MNNQFSQEQERMYIANCLCCLLAEAMKSCETCPFRIGLRIKAEQEKTPVFSKSNQTIGE